MFIFFRKTWTWR